MKSNRLLAGCLILTISLYSCFSPRPVIRIIPEETQTTWEKGKEFVSYRVGDFVVHSAYNGYNSKNLIFDIEIINNTGENILVQPEKFMLYPAIWNQELQDYIYSSVPEFAQNPESELLQIDIEESKAVAAQQNAQTTAAVACIAAIPLIVGAAVVDINNNKNGNNDEETVSATEIVSSGLDLTIESAIATDAVQEFKINSLNDARYTWENIALRKTTLSAGYSIRGNVFFPINYPKFAYDGSSTKKTKNKLVIPLNETDTVKINYQVIYIYPQ